MLLGSGAAPLLGASVARLTHRWTASRQRTRRACFCALLASRECSGHPLRAARRGLALMTTRLVRTCRWSNRASEGGRCLRLAWRPIPFPRSAQTLSCHSFPETCPPIPCRFPTLEVQTCFLVQLTIISDSVLDQQFLPQCTHPNQFLKFACNNNHNNSNNRSHSLSKRPFGKSKTLFHLQRLGLKPLLPLPLLHLHRTVLLHNRQQPQL